MITDRITELQEDIAALQETIDTFEIDPDEYENGYRNMLDELYPVEIAGIAFSAANVLEDYAPAVYQNGLNNYADTFNIDDDPEYQRLVEDLESLELELEDLIKKKGGKMKFKKVNWNNDEFSKWLQKIDPSWTSQRENNTVQYIGNGEVIATLTFKNIHDFDLFNKIIKIREDLINVPEQE